MWMANLPLIMSEAVVMEEWWTVMAVCMYVEYCAYFRGGLGLEDTRC